MIQFLPNELQIKILTNVITKTDFEFFCTLRTVCKKWNTFVPLVMHEVVISRLNTGVNFEPENSFIPIKLGVEFGSLTWPEFIESDLYKYEFDHQNSVCFKREIDKYITYVKLYSFTIAAWKLYYILDCLQINSKLTRLRKGFQYFP
ncbi:hypothetical protein F8M41_015003 [Gigaspora margarita]|uniref:F-box domain-containing protein n=1 Tax=Gigaspora margarita TaxID=4874 RepID=A0A8H4B3B3_GIGMA|nr:hypothetical protein F8M41_015003 [Gigaspora margarita]